MDKDRCYVRPEPGKKVDPVRRLMANRVDIAGIGWIVGFASSVDSAALPQAAKEFGVSEVTESLATGLFFIGFGCGTSRISSRLLVTSSNSSSSTNYQNMDSVFRNLYSGESR